MSTLYPTTALPTPEPTEPHVWSGLPSCPMMAGDHDPALARFGAMLE